MKTENACDIIAYVQIKDTFYGLVEYPGGGINLLINGKSCAVDDLEIAECIAQLIKRIDDKMFVPTPRVGSDER